MNYLENTMPGQPVATRAPRSQEALPDNGGANLKSNAPSFSERLQERLTQLGHEELSLSELACLATYEQIGFGPAVAKTAIACTVVAVDGNPANAGWFQCRCFRMNGFTACSFFNAAIGWRTGTAVSVNGGITTYTVTDPTNGNIFFVDVR